MQQGTAHARLLAKTISERAFACFDTAIVDWWIQLNRFHRTARVYEAETPKGDKYWVCELTKPYERFCGNKPREAIAAATPSVVSEPDSDSGSGKQESSSLSSHAPKSEGGKTENLEEPEA